MVSQNNSRHHITVAVSLLSSHESLYQPVICNVVLNLRVEVSGTLCAPYMGFVSLFSLKGCAQMALASHHIHLNPGSQLTKQAPRGWRGTDSHLLHPPKPPFYTHTHTHHHNHHKADSSAKSPSTGGRQSITVIASVFLKRSGSLSFRMVMNCNSCVICQSGAVSAQQSGGLRTLPEQNRASCSHVYF